MSDGLGRYSLGVDLGTTFVAAAVARGSRMEMFTLGDRTVVTPAVVYARDDGSLVTGEAANRRAVSNPDRVGREFKRRLGDPTPVMLGGAPHAVTALLAALLTETITKVTEIEGAPPDNVVLTHPANWGPYRRELFEEVPQLAGIPHARMITEPEAAAAHYAAARHLTDGDTVAVYDLGGGTFDATVLRKRAIGIDILGTPEGIERLGGVDFDDAILAHINASSGGALSELDLADPQTAIALARLRQDCIAAKEALSIDTEATIPVFLPNRHFDIRVTRAEFEDMIRAQIESTIGALTRTLRSADVEPTDTQRRTPRRRLLPHPPRRPNDHRRTQPAHPRRRPPQIRRRPRRRHPRRRARRSEPGRSLPRRLQWAMRRARPRRPTAAPAAAPFAPPPPPPLRWHRSARPPSAPWPRPRRSVPAGSADTPPVGPTDRSDPSTRPFDRRFPPGGTVRQRIDAPPAKPTDRCPGTVHLGWTPPATVSPATVGPSRPPRRPTAGPGRRRGPIAAVIAVLVLLAGAGRSSSSGRRQLL